MSKNTGKQYESLVQKIYQQFADSGNEENGISNVEVRHNVLLEGISGARHQVDVYWEFKFVGAVYKTIVEVKDWSTPVKMEQLMSFHSLLRDIPGSPNGIYVSRSGFQSGALTYAKTHGIQLVEIKPEDLQPIFTIHAKGITTYYDNIYLSTDDPLFDEGTSAFEQLKERVGQPVYTNVILVDQENIRFSFSQMMFEGARPYYYEPDGKRTKVETSLNGDWFWETGDERFPRVKISGYGFECYNQSEEDLLEVTLADYADYVIANLIDGQKLGFSSQRNRIVSWFDDDDNTQNI